MQNLLIDKYLVKSNVRLPYTFTDGRGIENAHLKLKQLKG